MPGLTVDVDEQGKEQIQSQQLELKDKMDCRSGALPFVRHSL